MNEQVWWYLARSSGIVALVLMVLSLVWGVLLATRILRPNDRPAWLLDLHRWFGWLSVMMAGLHLAGLALDGYVDFGWAELLVPGVSRYEPLGVALGVLSFWALAAVQLTSVIRRRLPRALWYRVHLLSYGTLLGSTLHAGMAGTDVTSPAYQVLALLLIITAVGAVLVRILGPGRSRPARANATS